MIDYHSSGNSSLFQLELISLWISEQIALPLAVINSAGGLNQYLVICVFLATQQQSQTQRHTDQALVVLLYVYLSP